MYFDVKFEKGKNEWKKFENDTADVFEGFDYTVYRDVRFKTTRRFQIDFIAKNDKRRFFVDCKNHAYIPPEKEYNFAKMPLKRAENFIDEKQTKDIKNIILLVTKHRTNSLALHNEGNGKIFSVDYNSLPTLLRDIEIYESELFTF